MTTSLSLRIMMRTTKTCPMKTMTMNPQKMLPRSKASLFKESLPLIRIKLLNSNCNLKRRQLLSKDLLERESGDQ